jgi:transposase
VVSYARKRAQLAHALQGQLRPHQSFVLAEWLTQIETLDETMARFDAQIQRACAAAADAAVAVALLDTIPGVSTTTAQILVAEIGTDRRRFPCAAAWAAWAGLAPGTNERAGQQRSGRTRQGTTWLRAVRVQAAQAAAQTKHTALAARYRRSAARRGAKRAVIALAHTLLVIALAHTLLVIASPLIARREPYQERGEDYLQHGDPERRTQR